MIHARLRERAYAAASLASMSSSRRGDPYHGGSSGHSSGNTGSNISIDGHEDLPLLWLQAAAAALRSADCSLEAVADAVGVRERHAWLYACALVACLL